MSDDEVDPELIELLRQSLGLGRRDDRTVPRETGILKDAEFVSNNAIDVSINMAGTKAAASDIYSSMRERTYSTESWGHNELHPSPRDGFSDLDIVNFVFTMDLLNFSFWSTLPEEKRYQVDYRGKRWTGYNSLVACLRRALDEGIPITTPRFWNDCNFTDDVIGQVFRSATDEHIPLLEERINVLRSAGRVLHELFSESETKQSMTSAIADDEKACSVEAKPEVEVLEPSSLQEKLEDPIKDAVADAPIESDQDALMMEIETADSNLTNTSTTAAAPPPSPDTSVVQLIEQADRSAGRLVNLLAKHFAPFRDETRFDGKRVKIMKRTQIFVADLWAALNGESYGKFDDIDSLTMFADYRVPQILHTLGVISYSPSLYYHIKDLKIIEPGHSWEVQLRGCSIWAVELIRREILKVHPDATINAVLIDFFLYDLAKEREKIEGAAGLAMPHHRTRSIWY